GERAALGFTRAAPSRPGEIGQPSRGPLPRRGMWSSLGAITSRTDPMPSFTTRPEIRGTFGMVASTHWIASTVGMSVLEKGGNAFDAAAAAGFALQVVEPHLNGSLGEAPILVWSEANHCCEMICGQGVA